MSANEYHEHIYFEDIEEIIHSIILKIGRPFPEDITDKVFQTIESDPELLRLYKLFAGENTHTPPMP